MSQFLHYADNAKAIAIPQIFSENSSAKKYRIINVHNYVILCEKGA